MIILYNVQICIYILFYRLIAVGNIALQCYLAESARVNMFDNFIGDTAIGMMYGTDYLVSIYTHIHMQARGTTHIYPIENLYKTVKLHAVYIRMLFYNVFFSSS